MCMTEEYILNLITELIEERKEKNLTPLILPSVELQRKIVENLRDTLNKLAKDGKIKAVKQLNGMGIALPWKTPATFTGGGSIKTIKTQLKQNNYICRANPDVRLYLFACRSISDTGTYPYTPSSGRFCNRACNDGVLPVHLNAI